jgi:anti-sigma regulatory factor (Ser/Thr protein kinase)
MNIIEINKDIDFTFINKLAQQFDDIAEDTKLLFRKKFSKPAGISYLSSLIESKKSFIKQIAYEENAISYLQRADFFKNFHFDIEENFNRHEVSNNMLECTKIQKDGDPDFVDGRLKKILESHLGVKKHLILGILLTTYEIVDNILEHSAGGEFSVSSRQIEKPGYVCAQYYSPNQIEIGISDSGMGIINSMEDAYPELSRKEILRKAFEINTTRHIKTMPSRGNVLAKLKEFVLESNGEIICRTNEYKITFNDKYENGIIEKEKDDLNGTHFQIIIVCQHDIDTKKIFNAEPSDYEDDAFDDFFDF